MGSDEFIDCRFGVRRKSQHSTCTPRFASARIASAHFTLAEVNASKSLNRRDGVLFAFIDGTGGKNMARSRPALLFLAKDVLCIRSRDPLPREAWYLSSRRF